MQVCWQYKSWKYWKNRFQRTVTGQDTVLAHCQDREHWKSRGGSHSSSQQVETPSQADATNLAVALCNGGSWHATGPQSSAGVRMFRKLRLKLRRRQLVLPRAFYT